MDAKKEIEEILKEYSTERTVLLPAIKKINRQLGFFSPLATDLVAEHFGISSSQVFATASFYDEIKTKKPCLVEIGVCQSLNCENKSGEKIIKSLENFFHIKEDEDYQGKIKVRRISCQGRCLAGPVMVINGQTYEKVTPGFAIELVRNYLGMGNG